ncbi:MAG TPA: hypothetical protein VGK67_41670 [Myxococcales bacterium]|jgi:hypothetical protein
MKRAYAALVLDLSLPVPEAPAEVHALGEGLRTALGLLERDGALRLEVALSSAVTSRLLRWGEERALQKLAERASGGQVSMLATASGGAFLPLVPPLEATRQLDLNEAANREALGEWVYRPEGLFPPQLGYSRSVGELAFSRGLPRILADSLALEAGKPLPRGRHFALQGRPGLGVFFVDRALSAAVDRGALHDAWDLHRTIAPRSSGYAVLRVPARSLRPGSAALRLLGSLGQASATAAATLRELLALFPEVEEVEPMACALGTLPAELAAGVPFARWSAPANELHALLWRLARLASEETARLAGEEEGGAMRALLDEALDCSIWRSAAEGDEAGLARVARGGALLGAVVRAAGAKARSEVLAEVLDEGARLAHLCAGRWESASLAPGAPPPGPPTSPGPP